MGQITSNMQKPTFDEEKFLWNKEYEYVIGLDEVGRGAFAGPLVASAVAYSKNVIEKENLFKNINDSKLLSPKLRNKLSIFIKKYAFCYSIVKIPVKTINKVGIGKANKMAFRKAVKEIIKTIKLKEKDNFKEKSFFALIDGFGVNSIKDIGLQNQKAIIKGDRKSITIASASIIAKVYRDRLMVLMHKKYPFYDFENNKGYGTEIHRKALKKFGLSEIHRLSFNLNKFL